MGNFYMESTQINYRRDEKLKTVDQKLQELSETSAIDTDIAPVFKSTNTYQPGDMVYYRNKLYVFNVEHTGTWAAADVTATDVTTEISSLKSGLTNYQVQNDLNLEVPDRKNLLNLKAMTATSAATVNIVDDTATIHGSVAWSACNDGRRNNLKYKAGKYYVKFNVVSATDYSFIDVGFRNGNDSFIGDFIRVTESGQYSGVIEISESGYFSIVINDDTPVDNTVVIEDIMVSPYDEAYTPYIPSVETRLESVENDIFHMKYIDTNNTMFSDLSFNTATGTDPMYYASIDLSSYDIPSNVVILSVSVIDFNYIDKSTYIMPYIRAHVSRSIGIIANTGTFSNDAYIKLRIVYQTP